MDGDFYDIDCDTENLMSALLQAGCRGIFDVERIQLIVEDRLRQEIESVGFCAV